MCCCWEAADTIAAIICFATTFFYCACTHIHTRTHTCCWEAADTIAAIICFATTFFYCACTHTHTHTRTHTHTYTQTYIHTHTCCWEAADTTAAIICFATTFLIAHAHTHAHTHAAGRLQTLQPPSSALLLHYKTLCVRTLTHTHTHLLLGGCRHYSCHHLLCCSVPQRACGWRLRGVDHQRDLATQRLRNRFQGHLS